MALIPSLPSYASLAAVIIPHSTACLLASLRSLLHGRLASLILEGVLAVGLVLGDCICKRKKRERKPLTFDEFVLGADTFSNSLL